ncbi:uncharacterized protein [Misgurnus anguillicaudatus]|uniref:uncharacterized protein n=1 Tax=Misgurnus anguillicaudatus TaxID=75329 RepID=UPI003CCF5DFE
MLIEPVKAKDTECLKKDILKTQHDARLENMKSSEPNPTEARQFNDTLKTMEDKENMETDQPSNSEKKNINTKPEEHEYEDVYEDPDLLTNYSSTGYVHKTEPILREQFKRLDNVTLHIAVTGSTGAGKSSFINAIRGLKSDDKNAAPTGVTETTMIPTKYAHPTMPNVTFWDLPGTGSPKFKAKKYLKEVRLETYDFFIIISSERFKENDIMLAKAIKERKKIFYFLRSKIDNDIQAESQRKDFDEQKLLSLIRQDCQRNLSDIGDPYVFLISSFDLHKYDFQALTDTLVNQLTDHKRDALVLSLPVYSSKILEEKINTFMKQTRSAAVASGSIAVAPVPGLSLACDAAILLGFFTKCYYAFGLDDDSVKKLSERVNNPCLKFIRMSPLVHAIRKKKLSSDVLSTLTSKEAAIKFAWSMVPGVGSKKAVEMSYSTTLGLLQAGLQELADKARQMLKAALKNIMADFSGSMDLPKALQTIGEQDPSAAATKAKEQLDALDNLVLNIAVTGETGTGKSAFINAFRGLGDDDDMSAPTGITETTNDVTMYTHPTKPNVKLYDLPGIGVPNLKADQYLNEVKFEIYDLFIIISSTRFKENDVFLAKEIKKKQKHFYFVRSKIDNDIYSASHSRNFNEDQVLCTIRENCCKNLKDVGNSRVFLISSYDLEKYDFQKLVDTIESELSEHKRFALVQCVPVCSLAMLEKKKKMMEKYVMVAALASGLGGLIHPSLYMTFGNKGLAAFLSSCHYAFGLDEESLMKLSEKVNKPVSLLKSKIKSPFVLALKDRLSVTPHLSMTNPVTSLDDLLDPRFILKRSQNAYMAFNKTYAVLNDALNEMIEDMTEVLRVAGLE